MARVLYRKHGLCLSGINTLSKTVVRYNSKRDIYLPKQRHVMNSLL